MSKLYVTANTDAIKTLRTARGHHWAKATVQSREGSIGISLDEKGNVEIRVSNESTNDPERTILQTDIWSLLRVSFLEGPTL